MFWTLGALSASQPDRFRTTHNTVNAHDPHKHYISTRATHTRISPSHISLSLSTHTLTSTMATPAATKRLTKEYAAISKSPPPYIIAHPSERNILEWHYILTGPPDTPYEGGQYWGTLMFPPDYPFAPPAIRMHTPSGRFQPSTRLCLSISDFHPKSFNPAWEVSTILTGLLSFMTSEEMTTGSVRASEAERKLFAQRTRWWNSTGGGSKVTPQQGQAARGIGAIKAGDGGARFRLEWPELDEENCRWMKEKRINPLNGFPLPAQAPTPSHCGPTIAGIRKTNASGQTAVGTVVQGGQVAREAGQSWLSKHRFKILFGMFVSYIFFTRILGDSSAMAMAQ